jgi:hypothetical protein
MPKLVSKLEPASQPRQEWSQLSSGAAPSSFLGIGLAGLADQHGVESWCFHARHLHGACRWGPPVCTHRLVLIEQAWSSFNPLRI